MSTTDCIYSFSIGSCSLVNCSGVKSLRWVILIPLLLVILLVILIVVVFVVIVDEEEATALSFSK